MGPEQLHPESGDPKFVVTISFRNLNHRCHEKAHTKKNEIPSVTSPLKIKFLSLAKMQMSTVHVFTILTLLFTGMTAESQTQQKKRVVQTIQQKQEQAILVADLAASKGITEGALAGILEGLISWDTGYGESEGGSLGDYSDDGSSGRASGVDADTWEQSGLGDELGDFNDYGSDQERQDAIDALAWEQSGAADLTGKDWNDFENDEEREKALKEAEENQKTEKEESSDDDETSEQESTESEQDQSDSDSEGIIGKQFPVNQPALHQMQVQHMGAVQVSARTQVRTMLVQLLHTKTRNK